MIIDILIIFLYLTITVCIAGFSFKKNAKDYFVCNKQYSLVTLVATLFATDIGAASIFYVSERFFESGAKFLIILSGNYLAQFLIAFFVVGKMKKWLGCLTPAEVIADIYSFKIKKLCGVCSILVSIGFVALQIHAFGHILYCLYGVPKDIAIIIGGGFTVLYTSFGGINAVIRTDVWQFCWIIGIVVLLVKIAISQAGGIDEIFSLVKAEGNNFELSKADMYLWMNFALVGFNPSFIQRVFIAKNIKQARDATIIHNCLVIIFFAFIGICGIAAHKFLPNAPYEILISEYITKFAPVGIRGLLVVGILATIMSTADSDLNIASVSAYRDLFNFKINNSNHLKVKFISLCLGLLAIIMSLCFDSIISILLFVINFWSLTFMFPLIFGVMGLKVSYKIVIIAIISSVFVTGVSEFIFELSELSSLLGALTNIIILLMGGLYTKYGAKIQWINSKNQKSIS